MSNKVDVTGSAVTGSTQVLTALDSHSQIIGIALIAALGLSFTVLSYFSDKRSKELFDTQKLVNRVKLKIEKSDDFASFVFDVWQKHNLESSEKRRKMLKALLEKESLKDINEYENFSRVLFIMQNANLRALKLLTIIYSDRVRSRPRDSNDGSDFFLNIQKLVPLVQEEENMHEQDIEHFVNELGNFGLLSLLHARLGGLYFNETKLAFDFLEYLNKPVIAV
jgi:hypothetical protein